MSPSGRGRLQRIPKPLRPLVQAVLDPLRRAPRHVADYLFRLHPRRVLATIRYFAAIRRATRRRAAEDALTVGVDIRALWGPLTGIGWYLRRLLEELRDQPDVRLRLYAPQVVLPPGFEAGTTGAASLPAGPSLEWVRYEIPDDLTLSPQILFRLLTALERRLVRADRNQILFAPNFYLPEHFALAEGRLVATIHDLTLWRFPWTMDEENRFEQERHLRDTLRRAAHVITDAEAVRLELIEDGHAEPERVTAIHLGPGQIVGRVGDHEAEESASDPGSPAQASSTGADGQKDVAGRIPSRFALHVGTFEPRKNLRTLIVAWSVLPPRVQNALPLVLCGERGWKNEELEATLARGVEEGWLIRLGYVDEETLAALYRRATLVVLASLYEGFGLPLVEAMSAGKPLLLSDIPVFREVAADAAHYVPAENTAAWSAAVSELAGDDAARDELAERGRARSRQFAWSQTASATLEVFQRAARS